MRLAINFLTLPLVITLLTINLIPTTARGQSAQKSAIQSLNQLKQQGKYHEAISYAKKILHRAKEQRLDSYHPRIMDMLYELTILCITVDDYKQADKYCERFRFQTKIIDKKFKYSHPFVSQVFSSLTKLYMILGKYQEAVVSGERFSTLTEKRFGSNSKEFADSLIRLANAYKEDSDKKSDDKAEHLFKNALKIFKRISDKYSPMIALIHLNLGTLYAEKGKHKDAEFHYKQALNIERNVPDRNNRQQEALIITRLGWFYTNINKLSKAERYFKEAMSIYKQEGVENAYLAETTNGLAYLYRQKGEYTESEKYFNQTIAIQKKIFGNKSIPIAVTLNDFAELYSLRSEYSEAESMYKKALNIRREMLPTNHPDIAVTLTDLASLYKYSLQFDKFDEATRLYKRALKIYENFEPQSFNTAGILYHQADLEMIRGNYGKCLTQLKHALNIEKRVFGKNHPRVISSEIKLADFFYAIGDEGRALSYLLNVLKRIESDKSTIRSQAAVRFQLAGIYRDLGESEKENNELKELNKIIKKSTVDQVTKDVFHSLLIQSNLMLNKQWDKALKIILDGLKGSIQYSALMGYRYLKFGQFEKAVNEFNKCIEHEKSKDSGKNKDFIVGSFIGLALSYEGMRDFNSAKQSFQKAIDIIEGQWKQIGLYERKNFLIARMAGQWNRLDAYEGMVRVLIKAQKRGWEKRSLWYAEHVKSRTLVEILSDRRIKLANKKDNAMLKLDRKFNDEIRLLNERYVKQGKSDIEKKLQKKLRDYENFINETKFQNSELASLFMAKSSKIPSDSEVEDWFNALMLPSDRMLIEYFTTRDQVYVWLIKNNRIDVSILDLNKKQLRDLVNDLYVKNGFTQYDNTKVAAPPMPSPPDDYCKRKILSLKSSNVLYRKLIEPFAHKITSDKLIIVPHGFLHRVPFAALNDGAAFLLDKYTLSYASSVGVIRHVIDKRPRNPNKFRFAGFAVPESEYTIPLFSKPQRLEDTEKEVNGIAAIFPNKTIYSAERATKNNVMIGVKGRDAVHFSCHGLFRANMPMQSGLLLHNGLLQVHEIFGLELKDANIVTLSACETALSKIYGGDDLVGLSRGFIYAGAPSIMATLWSVCERSTYILMVEFYKNWIQRGMTKAQALRQAQLNLKSSDDYSSPQHWAPFIMIGDWM